MTQVECVKGNVGSEKLLERGQALRNAGKKYLISKQYETAAFCYSAALQVMEGIGGYESGELRRKCGLLLAECEIKNCNYYSAIARCSHYRFALLRDRGKKWRWGE